MSDDEGFDKEAEREKLREKFEEDEQKRQSTQRMSELLLKGATMTNSHCDRCGDPLFRYEGETFCPSCGGGEGAQAAGGNVPEGDTQVQTGETTVDIADETPTVETGAEAAERARAGDGDGDLGQGASPAGADRRESAENSQHPSVGDSQRQSAGDTRRQPATREEDGERAVQRQSRRSESPGQSNRDAGSDHRRTDSSATQPQAGEGRAALERALASAARRAENATDPSSAKAWLAAAREASEALATLDGR